MTQYKYNKRDLYEDEFYDLCRAYQVSWIQLNRGQGADNILLGECLQIVEVKNTAKYELTAAEEKQKALVEQAGGRYWVVFDTETSLAAIKAARGE